MVTPKNWLPEQLRPGAHTISPTAHYTGYVWAHHGLGEPRLATLQGRVMHTAGRAVMGPLELMGGPTLEHFLLARHRIIDRLLDREIASGSVRQVVELAAGMSPRSLDLVRRHADVTCVEVDLPAMAARKKAALARIGTDPGRHHVVAADVFSASLSAVFDALDPDQGIAVVTEGLLSYFPADRVLNLWCRLAQELRAFSTGVYLSDLHVRSSAGVPDRLFALGLGLAVRGRVHLHFDDDAAAADALRTAGFATPAVHAPSEYAGDLPGMTAVGADRVRVVEARP